MGESGCDVKLSSAAKAKFPFAVECKNQENLNIWAALRQAEDHATKSNTVPLVVFTRNRSQVYVALPLDDFLLIQGSSQLTIVPGGYKEESLSGFPGYAGDPPTASNYEEMMERSHRELNKVKYNKETK